MTFSLLRAAALCGLVVLGGCNTSKPSVAPTTALPPSPDGPNPTISPDGTVPRLHVAR